MTTLVCSSQKLSIWYILENVLLCSAEERLIILDDLRLSCSFPAGVIKLDRLTVFTVIENSAFLVCYQIYARPLCGCIFYDHSVLIMTMLNLRQTTITDTEIALSFIFYQTQPQLLKPS